MNTGTKTIVIAAVLTFAIVLTVAIVALHPGEDETDRVFPLPISEEEKEYPTSQDAKKDMEAWLEELRATLNDPNESRDGMVATIHDARASLLTMIEDLVFVKVDYYLHPMEMNDEYLAWSGLYTDAYDGYMTTIKEALQGPASETVTAAIEYCGWDVSNYLGYAEVDPEEKALLDKIRELNLEYDSIMGEIYTNAEEELEQCTKAIEVYIELIGVNNQYAAMLGYENYMDYAYNVTYGRDYGTDDVNGFLECIDEAILVYAKAAELSNTEEFTNDNIQWITELDRDEVRPFIEPFLDRVDADMGDLLDYMYDYNLLYTDKVDGQVLGGFCDSLVMHGGACIYMAGFETRFMTSMIHELGHASNMCLVEDGTSCNDVMEIHSQGLEFLLCEYQELNSMNGCKTMTIGNIMHMMSSIILSAAITELENWAYEVDADKDDGIELTVEGLVEKFANGIGGDIYLTQYIDLGYGFINVRHIIDVPGYHISYGTSYLNAAEIWQTSKTDFDAATQQYVGLLKQSGVYGYEEAVQLAGLSNMLEGDNAENILTEVLRILEEEYAAA